MKKTLLVLLLASLGLTGCIAVPIDGGYYGPRQGAYYGGYRGDRGDRYYR